MRIIRDKSVVEGKKKIFLSFEGIKTEFQYFEGIIRNRNNLKIDSNIEIVILLRNHTFLGWSNPLKAFERTKFCIDNLSNNQRNVSSFVSSIVEFCFYQTPYISTKIDASFLYDSLLENLNLNFYLKKSDNFNFEDLRGRAIKENIINYFKDKYIITGLDEFIQSQFISFNPNRDKVCLIVDRDKRSVTNTQYDSLVNKCNSNNFKLYVSNPCFEFWLLLHFNEVFNLDRDKLLDNTKLKVDDDTLHFCEFELKKLLPDFEKNNICFDKLIDRIDLAIENEKSFSQSVVDIKISLGSNVGILIKEILKL